MIDFNNTKQLKYIILVCSVYAVFIVVGLIINFIQFYFNFDNPLLPRYLIDYVAFPLYFILSFQYLLQLSFTLSGVIEMIPFTKTL